MSSDHERIWLQPKCCAGEYDGRQWCQDNVFDDGQCEDGNRAIEYIRADLARTFDEGDVERVARALFNYKWVGVTGSPRFSGERKYWLSSARAALAALAKAKDA